MPITRQLDLRDYNQTQVVAAFTLLTSLSTELAEMFDDLPPEDVLDFWQRTAKTRALAGGFRDLLNVITRLDPR